MGRRIAVCLSLVSLLVVAGCAARMPALPDSSLQRSLYPGLGDLRGDAISQALDQELAISGPVSGGLAWLSEAPPGREFGSVALSEYHRTGVLEAGLKALRQQPFSGVVSLPTIPQVTDSELDSTRQELAERTLRESVDAAAKELLSQVSLRLARE